MILEPTVPVEVETRKNIFISQSWAGGRKTVSKSGAFRFYTLNFKFRDQAEYLEKLTEWSTNYPGTAVEWINPDLAANGFFYLDSELKATVDDPNTFSYDGTLRSRDALVPTNPGTVIFPYKPNFAYDITTVRQTLVSDSVGFARVARPTSVQARQFQYTFKNRTLTETLAAENFWAFHYPKTQISFNDETFDEDMTFWFDSNFKWTVNGINLIDYTFVFTEVMGIIPAPSAPTTLTAVAASSSTINLAWDDNASNELGFVVERCTGAACTGFVQVGAVGANTEVYNDNGLTPNTLYRYRVRAYNSGGFSSYSNIAQDTTDAP